MHITVYSKTRHNGLEWAYVVDDYAAPFSPLKSGTKGDGVVIYCRVCYICHYLPGHGH